MDIITTVTSKALAPQLHRHLGFILHNKMVNSAPNTIVHAV